MSNDRSISKRKKSMSSVNIENRIAQGTPKASGQTFNLEGVQNPEEFWANLLHKTDFFLPNYFLCYFALVEIFNRNYDNYSISNIVHR